MKLQFLGANRQVTGSRHVLEASGRKVMVDCGMYQERPFLSRNWEPCPVPPAEIDVLLLTHAHLDHCGLIPKLVREGFRGDILATPASIDLARIVLEDAARIQVEDAEYKKKRHQREGRRGPHPEVPLYTPEEAEVALTRFRAVTYDKPVKLAPDLEAVYRDAGHILGSALIEISAGKAAARETVVFSGDIGPPEHPLLQTPHPVQRADYVVMESTYGDRDHGRPESALDELARIVNETVERGGNLIIPTFAIDRAQQLLHLFSELTRAGRIPRITIFLDSPMATHATTIYKRYPHLLDEELRKMLETGRHPFQFPGLHFVRTSEESRAINSIRGSSVILAGSGMCTGGRVKHHLRHNIERPESTVLFVGFQARETLGRRILDGDPEVRIHNQRHAVRARIEYLSGLSAHADRSGLMEWLGGFDEPPKRLFLTHGEEEAAMSLAEHVRSTLGWSVDVPEYGEVFTAPGGS